jgi:DNA adenine methylase
VLTGFIGFGCSYSGKWFGGYAHNKTGRNYAREAKESLLRDMSTLMDAEILCKDYREVELPEGCVIYADPPYNNTTGYNNEKFDSEAFWDYARRTSQDHLMFISEQVAPDDFIPIWERQVTRTVDINKQNYFKATEKLFIHKCNAN